MITFLFLIFTLGCCFASAFCPAQCDHKSCMSGLLLCTETGLNVIPEVPSPGIVNVIIMNQRFDRTILTYKNLSRYGPEEINLKQMTLKNCGLTDIESESFSHLIHLTDLDLSQNDLRTIRPRSFKALNLKFLRLDGNKNIQLTKDSLKGLVVNILSLANCGLTELHFESIREISGHLTKLVLSDNNLKTLSFRFFLLFRRLEEIRLDRNRLRCDCHLRWLVGIMTKLPHSQSSEDISTTCYSPLELRGKEISSLSDSMFECLVPSLKKINVNILTEKTATLSCTASPQSDAKVYWQRRNGVNETLTQIEYPNNASIYVRSSSVMDQYSCFVVNDNGNVTVDLNIHWPPSSSSSPTKAPAPLDKFINTSGDIGSKNIQYLFMRQFSLLEMLLSVASTFVITIVLFSLIYFFLARRIRFAKDNISLSRSGYDGGLYSDIPVYDVPRLSSPQHLYPASPSAFHNTQLIDFKTQRLIPSTLH